MRDLLNATRNANDLAGPENGPDAGKPGYQVKGVAGQARARPDFFEKNLHIARPLFPKETGGPYSDPFGALEGTRPRPGIQATPEQYVADFEHRRRVS
jgi:hypothetical protein